MLHTIPFRSHLPCMTPCYPNTDSNMTCHSEREQCHWGLLQVCPLCHFGREDNSTMTALRFLALGSMPLCCKPSAPTLAHPPTAQTPPLTGSTHSDCFTIFVLFTYWLKILIVAVVTVRFFLPFCFATITSVFPCTIPQTRPTKLALIKGWERFL